MHTSKTHMIILAHPNRDSFNAALCNELVTLTRDAGYSVVLRDLYAMQFRCTLDGQDLEAMAHGKIMDDVRREQEYITEAPLMSLIYPIWWTGMPAIMKGYIDRVFTSGFAYRKTENGNVQGMLGGKRAVILNTCGTERSYYEEVGMLHSMRQTVDAGIFAFCGMEVVEHRFFGSIMTSSREERANHLRSLPKLYEKYLSPR